MKELNPDSQLFKVRQCSVDEICYLTGGRQTTETGGAQWSAKFCKILAIYDDDDLTMNGLSTNFIGIVPLDLI